MSTGSKLDLKALQANTNIAARNYWKERMAGLEWNAYFDAEPNADKIYKEHTLAASEQVNAALLGIAASEKARHIVLLAALGVLAQKCSSHNDVVVFTPVYEGHYSAEANNVLVPVRMDINSSSSFTQLLTVLKDDLMKDFRQADYPLEKILGTQLQELPSIGMLVEEVQEEAALSMLSPGILFAFRLNDALELTIKYTGFETSLIEQLAQLYFNLLLQLIGNKETRTGAIELITQDEKRLILEAFNNTEKTFPRDKTILDLFHEQVQLTPTNIAIQFEEQQLTYAQLNERSNQLAHYLENKGLQKGSIIAVQLDRSLELMIAIFGILKAGCVYLPLTKDYPQERVQYALEHSNASLLFTENDFPGYSGQPVTDINLATPGDIAYIIYTSGSTGRPKGVLIKHGSVVNRLNWMQNEYQLTEHDIILQKTPVVFDVSVWELFWWSFTGAKLVLAQPGAEKDPAAICKLIDDEKITVLHFVPSMLNMLLNYLAESRQEYSLSSIRHAFASGEELKVIDAQSFLAHCPAAQLHNLYGPTEATVDVSYHQVSPTASYRRIPIGKPIDNTTLLIFNKEQQLQPIGIPGELHIGGVNLSVGYLGQPELTSERFIQNPLDAADTLYRTGDLARWLPNGEIEFLGRIDNQVKIRGNRIELGEIEHVINSAPGVKNAVVLTKEGAAGLQLVAYVAATDFSEDALRNILKLKLPEYMMPAYFIAVDSIPVTVNGKADRKKLLSLKQQQTTHYAAPETSLQHTLAGLWKAVLGNERIGIDESFFRIGGDSILAVKLIGLVNNELPLHISMPDVYGHDTIRKLSAFIEQSKFADVSKEYEEIGLELDAYSAAYMKEANNDLIEAVYPMSDIEKSMCFVHKSRPEDILYFEQIMQRVAYENLDKDVLQKAIDLLVEKHEILRIGFDMRELAHIIYKKVNCQITFRNYSDLPEEVQKEKIQHDLQQSRQKHFDLDAAPLWRAVLYKLGEGHHELLFEYHHAVLDGWSYASLLTELNNTYGKLLRGEPVQLQRLQASFRDYIIQELHQKQSKETLDFWKNELKGYKRLKLNSGTAERVFGSVRETYPGTLVAQLEEAAGRLNTSVKNIMLAAYVYSMKILSCESDITVGLVSFTRPLKKDGEKMLGCFLNTIPFRVKIPERITWIDFVKMIDKKALELKQYEHLSLFEINQAAGARNDGENPLFDTFFNYINWHVRQDMILEKMTDSQIVLEEFDTFLRGNTFFDANYDVNKERIYCMHEYSSPFMTRETFALYNENFHAILAEICERPGAVIEMHESFWKKEEEKVKNDPQQVNRLMPWLLSYWKEHLGDEIPALELPTDKQRNNLYKAASVEVDIAGEEILLMAAFKIVLHKYSQQPEIVIGTGNSMPLKSSFSPTQTVSGYVSSLKQAYEAGLKHNLLPFGGLGIAPFKVVFEYDGGGQFDFNFSAKRRRLTFNENLFTHQSIASFIQHLKEVFRQLVGTPNAKLSDITIITAEEKQQLASFNNTAVSYPGETVMHLFDEQVERTPGNTALIFGKEKMNYRELQQTSNKIASYLQTVHGIQQGDLVGLLLEREMNLIPCIFGVLKAGAAYVPIDPNNPAERIHAIIKDSGIKVLITRSKYMDASLPGIIDLDKVSADIEQNSSQPLNIKLSGNNLAYVIYTSGSTGKPKGVMIEHHSILNLIQHQQRAYPLNENGRFLLKTSYTFDVSIPELFGWFLQGGALSILAPGAEGSPRAIINTIECDGVTHLNFVPSMFSAFVDELQGTDLDRVKSMQYIMLAGEILPTELAKKFLALQLPASLNNLYGPTEATVYCTGYSIPANYAGPKMPIGKPFSNARIYILDNNNNLQPIGVPGELCIAGDGVAKGYLHNETLTQEKFIDNPFEPGGRLYKTGDWARWLPDGNIEFFTRIDNQVKIRGFRIELGEIESLLAVYPSIRDNTVLVKENEGDKYLVAYYTANKEIPATELREYLSGLLPDYMVPAYYMQMESFPLTASGKLNRKALPDPSIRVTEKYVAPSNNTEEQLVQIWSEVLKIKKDIISITSNFFELGGHSLKATVLANQIEKQFSIQLPIKELFNKPTIKQQSEFIKVSEWLTRDVEPETTGSTEVII